MSQVRLELEQSATELYDATYPTEAYIVEHGEVTDRQLLTRIADLLLVLAAIKGAEMLRLETTE